MASNFGWVDFASENRQKMMDVVKLFREKDTVDELGIGTIRDAFANHFFPGTSTIQTRVKYMLFIPWIYQKIENKEITYPRVTKRARRYEIKLIFRHLNYLSWLLPLSVRKDWIFIFTVIKSITGIYLLTRLIWNKGKAGFTVTRDMLLGEILPGSII